MAPIRAGVAYWAIVFTFGFLFGAVRVLAVQPRLGAVAAVLLELPIILTVSFIACGFLLQRCDVPGGLPARLLMGTTAFTCLMIGEIGLSMVLFQRSLQDSFEFSLAGFVGLAGQIGFAAMPLLRK